MSKITWRSLTFGPINLWSFPPAWFKELSAWRKKEMKLYDVPRDSMIRVINDTKIPPEVNLIDDGDILHFSHIDGMYSYCINLAGEVVYPAAWTEVEVLDDE